MSPDHLYKRGVFSRKEHHSVFRFDNIMANIAFFIITTTVLITTGSLVVAMPYSAAAIAGQLSAAPGNYTSATSNTTGSLVAAIPYSAAATVNTANKAVYLRFLGKMLETIFVAPVVWVARFLYTFY